MAGTTGNTRDAVKQALERDSKAFNYADFFGVVRLMQALSADGARVGHSRLPAQDPVRFGQSPSLGFAASSIESVELGPVPKINVNCFGLFGPNGPLPVSYTERALESRDGEDAPPPRATSAVPRWPSSARGSTFAEFCDIFHHRMISLFYRAWEANQKVVGLDRPGQDRFAFRLGSLCGMGFDSLLDRDAVPDAAKRFYAGHLANQTRHADGLCSILEEFFGIKAEIQTLVGRWIDVPPDNLCELGAPSAVLSDHAILGAQAWDCQMSFLIRLGPMSLADFERLLPHGEAFKKLSDWVRNYVGDDLLWDVQFILDKEEVPSTPLGELTAKERGELARQPRPPGSARLPLAQAPLLGYTTWLGDDPFAEHAGDVVIDPTELDA